MELILLGGAGGAFYLWYRRNRAVQAISMADVIAAELAAEFSAAEAEAAYTDATRAYMMGYLHQQDIHTEDMRLLLVKAAACRDRVNQLDGEPHGYVQRAHLRGEIFAELVKTSGHVNNVMQKDRARRTQK